MYSIGLGTYLRLEVDASRLPAQYPVYGTLELVKTFSVTHTGLSPSIAEHSSSLLLPKLRSKDGPQHHISFTFLQRIQFALCRVQSLSLAASRLIFFPTGTKTFQFPVFPILTDLKRDLIQDFPDQRLLAPPRNFT